MQFRIFLICLLVMGDLSNAQLAPKKLSWPFEGILGNVDRQAAQRGFQVYKEVCGACHGLNQVSYHKLQDLGFSKEEVKILASTYQILEEKSSRVALPTDKIASPYQDTTEARSANNGMVPPDLSLILKAHKDAANYVYSLLTGYTNPPANFKINDGSYYNLYAEHYQLKMPPPLIANQLQYQDGTRASIEQMAKDVVIFLQWAAEPEMEHRKSLGLKVMMYLIILLPLLYVIKERIWQPTQKNK